MLYKVADLLNDALRNLQELLPQFQEGSPDHNEELCGVLETLIHPTVPSEFADLTIEFSPHEVDGPRAAAGNEYRKICAVMDFLSERSAWGIAGELSQIASGLQLALANLDWLRLPPLM